ncbi:hypothetical protein AOLI_G00103750 [Acnodon oligacanthus]
MQRRNMAEGKSSRFIKLPSRVGPQGRVPPWGIQAQDEVVKLCKDVESQAAAEDRSRSAKGCSTAELIRPQNRAYFQNGPSASSHRREAVSLPRVWQDLHRSEDERPRQMFYEITGKAPSSTRRRRSPALLEEEIRSCPAEETIDILFQGLLQHEQCAMLLEVVGAPLWEPLWEPLWAPLCLRFHQPCAPSQERCGSVQPLEGDSCRHNWLLQVTLQRASGIVVEPPVLQKVIPVDTLETHDILVKKILQSYIFNRTFQVCQITKKKICSVSTPPGPASLEINRSCVTEEICNLPVWISSSTHSSSYTV